MNFLEEVLKKRRSVRKLSSGKIVSDERIKEIVEFVYTYSPSAFNAQEHRAVVLLNDSHKKFWDIVKEALKKIVTDSKIFEKTEEKLNGFYNGYGTILFFIDTETVKKLEKAFTNYKDFFTTWANHGEGIAQILLWILLENEGLGASIQHYNPIIDNEVKRVFDIPQTWELVAQMPFGKPNEELKDKTFLPIEQKVIIKQ
ncbi:MAG: nitroreductase family protein [Elusimicrobiota bacterium]|jgi:predicted oxidoreductase (fatty acid repression mutant protein)|nr:nitroreductase family protein [Elusimicrobiota bacterium]